MYVLFLNHLGWIAAKIDQFVYINLIVDNATKKSQRNIKHFSEIKNTLIKNQRKN